MFLFFVPRKLMAALTYRDDKILARNVLLRPFFCLTPAEPFFRPDRSSTAPSCRVAVKDGRAFRGHPKGLSLTAASTMAHWRYRSGRGSRVGSRARLVTNGKRRSSRLPASRSRRLYRSPGTPIGKSLDYLDFATIKLPAPAQRDAISAALCSRRCSWRSRPLERRTGYPTLPFHWITRARNIGSSSITYFRRRSSRGHTRHARPMTSRISRSWAAKRTGR